MNEARTELRTSFIQAPKAAGMRVSLGLSLVLVILAEMLVDSHGIGFLILDMQRSFRVPEMYAWVIILGLLGLLLNALFEWIEGKLAAWRPR